MAKRHASTKTSSKATSTRVRRPAGKTYVVKKALRDGVEVARPVSIRNLAHWQLGALEEGTVFHALYRDKKGLWLWGYAVKGHGKELSYVDHSHCGWVMKRHLKRRRDLPFKRPPLKYSTWDRRVFDTVEALYLNLAHDAIPHPVVTEKRVETFKGYYNCGPRGSKVGGGGEIDVNFAVAVRYRNAHGWYMARKRYSKKDDPNDPGWFFIHESNLHTPTLKEDGHAVARKLTSRQARLRAKKKLGRVHNLSRS